MDKGYQSILNKETLAYNLWYHLQQYDTFSASHEIIKNILTSFEVKNGD
jgi:hypothetical protein